MIHGGRRGELALGLLATLAGLTLVLHLIVAALQPDIGYGFHRDDLLYLAMGKCLSHFGMESAPGIAMVAAIERALFGERVLAIRFAPALAGAAIVFLAGWMAREMGGGRWAQGLAALAVMLPPVFPRTHTLFQPVSFDQLAWTAAAAGVVWTAAHDDRHGWVATGAALGFGLLFKPTALLWGFALLLGALATARRRDLAAWTAGRRRPPALRVGIVGLLVLLALGPPQSLRRDGGRDRRRRGGSDAPLRRNRPGGHDPPSVGDLVGPLTVYQSTR